MKRTSLILIAVFALVVLPAAFAQSTTSQDPSTQPSTQATPTAQQPNQSTGTPSSAASSSDAQRSFVGSIAKTGGKFVLHTGGTDYQLDDQAQAGKFEGKDVKVTGQLDQTSNTIKVASIEPYSSM